MIPVRLEIRNFLSYAEPEALDFTGFSVACITGPNGAGKSGLLDAMTWALWGAARGCEGGMHQERLIRDGTEEAVVDFTFELQGLTYRVIRRRSRSGKPDVRFLLLDGGDWRNLAGETARETDVKIHSTLRMDFRTFAASAFFVQGRTDDFLRMTPQGRKEVFSQLLSLDTYERLSEVARDAAREADRRRSVHANEIEQHRPAREEVDRVERELHDARGRMERAQAAVLTAKVHAGRARDELASHEKAIALFESERSQLTSLDRTLQQVQQTIQTKRQAIVEIDALLARGDEVAERLAEADALREEDAAARIARDRAAEIARHRAGIAERLEAERRALIKQRDDASARLLLLQTEDAEIGRLAEQLDALEGAIAESGDPGAATDEMRRQLDVHNNAVARFEEQVNALELRIAEAKEKVALIGGGGGECPVCGTELDEAHRTKVKTLLEAEGRGLVVEQDAARASCETSRKELARCTEELERLKSAEGEYAKMVATRTALAARVERRLVVDAELATVRAESERAVSLLDGDAFASELLTELRTLDAELSSVYDQTSHDEVLARLRELRPYEALKGQLSQAMLGRRDLEQELDDATCLAHELIGQRDPLSIRVATLETQLVPGETLREACLEADGALDATQREATGAATWAAALQERLEAATRDVSALEAAEAAERDAALDHRRYVRLAEAFGRNGIPQRIIENERPFLEHEANRILDRLAEDPMAVQFQFHKDTKAGKSRETLEVLVRPHDADPRDFAMFSGGEAFRIAFAVRLAMSKLLVRRAGARLETLVIDEGFGTQDPQGKERLIEAINLAREEFAKVLVITHLEDLKDQFGVQIAVQKGAEGSTVRIHQG